MHRGIGRRRDLHRSHAQYGHLMIIPRINCLQSAIHLGSGTKRSSARHSCIVYLSSRSEAVMKNKYDLIYAPDASGVSQTSRPDV